MMLRWSAEENEADGGRLGAGLVDRTRDVAGKHKGAWEDRIR